MTHLRHLPRKTLGRMTTLKQVQATELGDDDMHKLLPGVPITEYAELANKMPGEVMDGKGRGIIFYTEKETPTSKVGHWLGILRRGNTVEMFDPYGGKGDPWQLDHTWISARTGKQLHEDKPLLALLLARTGLTVVHNPYRLQTMKSGINTCGRHVVGRLWRQDLDAHAYANQIKQQGNPDAVVAQETYAKLGH